MEPLTAGQSIEIHDEIIARTGGEPGVLNRGNLEFVVAQVTEGFTDRQTAWPTKAAQLLSGIIKGHPFVDDTSGSASSPVTCC